MTRFPLSVRTLKNREVLLRIIADIIMVNFSFAFSILLYLSYFSFNLFIRISPFLTLLSMVIFFLFGFYTYGRVYRGKYKIGLIIGAVSVVYLLGGLLLRFALRLPTQLLFISWSFTSSLLAAARVGSLVYSNIVKTERKKLNSKGEKPIENILVIGGGGYIGSVLATRLLKRGYKVRVFDLFLYGEDSRGKIRGAEVRKGDFRHIDKIVESLEEMDAVIHLGAIVGDEACRLNEKVTLETNLLSTRFIVEAAKAFSCQRFIFASTCSVYGASPHVLSENSPCRPLSLYATTKLFAEEEVLKLEGNGFVSVVLRFATVYGPSFRPRFDLVVNTLAGMAAVDKKITVFGGKQIRPLIHTADVADAVIRVLEAPRKLVSGEIFNVGNTRENYKIAEVARIIKEICPDAEVVFSCESADRRDYFVSFEKIEKVLGFKTKKQVADGVSEIISQIRCGEIANYKDIKFNNYAYLADNSYTKEVKWCDLLSVIRNVKTQVNGG